MSGPAASAGPTPTNHRRGTVFDFRNDKKVRPKTRVILSEAKNPCGRNFLRYGFFASAQNDKQGEFIRSDSEESTAWGTLKGRDSSLRSE
jgi:hypothetical protein